MLFKVFDNETVVSLGLDRNTASPMLATELGIVIDVRFEQ
jgi:hypothetical protein